MAETLFLSFFLSLSLATASKKGVRKTETTYLGRFLMAELKCSIRTESHYRPNQVDRRMEWSVRDAKPRRRGPTALAIDWKQGTATERPVEPVGHTAA